ncbi:tyrosine-type recombinase/integrase [Micromonospora sp. DT44]|uniref:tyrosine-type recombinase/integrase n=1 Tax=Micromonospora sp. DT44 TaxID=3393439 RepID=UPI003CF20523
MEPDEDEVATDVVALPRTLVRELRKLKRQQDLAREALGDEYRDHGLVFCQSDGRPIDPRRDLEDWYEILAMAGLPRSGTHVARHSAATMLLDAGHDSATVQKVMGWADIRTARRYATPSEKLSRQAAQTAERVLFRPVSDLAERRARKAAG